VRGLPHSQTCVRGSVFQRASVFLSNRDHGYGIGIWGSSLARTAGNDYVVGRGTADVMASMISAPSIPSSKRGLETSTRPWSASVGDRLPRAADVHTSTSISQQSLDEEDANVDRKSKAFVETAKSQSGEMSTIKDSTDEDLLPSGSTIARVVARHVNDSSDPNQQHRRSSAFKRDRGSPDRSSAMERCLNDRSRPERMRRADVDLR
jgi:hypothetical protein